MKMSNAFYICLLAGVIGNGPVARAEETKMEKIETQKNQTVDSVKSTYRDAKDKGCEVINGKMQCLGKKIRNKSKSMSDKVKTDGTEIKNKVD